MVNAVGNRAPRPGLLLLLALTVVLAAYSNAVGGDFVWDDLPLIADQPKVHELRPLREYFTTVFWEKSASYDSNPVYYRPVITLTYALDWVRGGGRPDAFHLTNVLLHLAACALLFGVARRFGAAPAPAAIATALFGVLPRLTESVAWVSGRTDVLAAVFALAALLTHTAENAGAGRRIAAAGLLFLALASKEVALASLAALVTLELLRARGKAGGWREAALRLAPAGVATAAYLALRTQAQWGQPRLRVEMDLLPRLAAPLQALGAYLLMLLDPLRPRLQIGMLRVIDARYVAAGVVALGLVGWTLRAGLRARWRAQSWALAAFVGTSLGLVLHVIPIRLNVVAADRFLYFPAAGLAVAAALAWERLGPAARRGALAASLLALPALGWATYVRNPDWGDDLRLWRVGVETTPPKNILPRVGLGNVLMRRRLFEQAGRQYETALPYAGEDERPTLLGSLANVRSELGDYDGAVALMGATVAAEPALALNHFNLGVAEARRLAFGEAERELERAIALLPSYRQAKEALEIVRRARRDIEGLPPEAPGEGAAICARRARLWERLGRYRDAERAWLRVLDARDAAPADLRSSVAFLVWKGTFAAAEHAASRAGETGLVRGDELGALSAEVAQRRADLALAADLP
jgi:tetratricopeptide (TPR) repeat protein